jgi:geranylgeranyl diphosphate synthase type II
MLRDATEEQTAMLRAAVERRLPTLLPASAATPRLLDQALRYALLSPGKRLRPVLAMLSASHFGCAPERALDFACALELVHAASLVLDDLPCMDNAEQRRGQPTLHRAFGDDTAVLTAVALLNQAYAVIATCDALPVGDRLSLVLQITGAVGLEGLCAGQVRDLRDPLALRTRLGLEQLNHQKTGVMFVAAVEGGARCAGADGPRTARAGQYARHLGLAFQLQDDLLDALSTTAALGKDVGKDAGKYTTIDLLGVEGTRAAMLGAIDEAIRALGPDGDGPLAAFARGLAAPVSVPSEG